jgi:hypothetical protein
MPSRCSSVSLTDRTEVNILRRQQHIWLRIDRSTPEAVFTNGLPDPRCEVISHVCLGTCDLRC